MDKMDAELFNDSLERCSRKPDFLDRFYDIFLASSDEVTKKFAQTDFRKQTTMLKESLYIMMMASTGPEFTTHLERIAKHHSRTELDIRPEMYDLWLDCLIQAVQDFDPSFDEDIETAWRQILGPGITFMKSKY